MAWCLQDKQGIRRLLKLIKKLGCRWTNVKSLLLILSQHLRSQLIQQQLWLRRKPLGQLQMLLFRKKCHNNNQRPPKSEVEVDPTKAWAVHPASVEAHESAEVWKKQWHKKPHRSKQFNSVSQSINSNSNQSPNKIIIQTNKTSMTTSQTFHKLVLSTAVEVQDVDIRWAFKTWMQIGPFLRINFKT